LNVLIMLKPFVVVRFACWFLSLGVLVCLTSCSGPGFAKSWHRAKAVTSAHGVEGAWEGHWKSDFNEHRGRLFCAVAAAESPDQPHSFHYRATWMRILSGSYRAHHRVTSKGCDQWSFVGTHQMPAWAGGLYHYDGLIQEDTFTAKYRCEIDHGTFTMSRVKRTADKGRQIQP